MKIFNRYFVFRRQPAEFFFSKKMGCMKAGQNNKYYKHLKSFSGFLFFVFWNFNKKWWFIWNTNDKTIFISYPYLWQSQNLDVGTVSARPSRVWWGNFPLPAHPLVQSSNFFFEGCRRHSLTPKKWQQKINVAKKLWIILHYTYYKCTY